MSRRRGVDYKHLLRALLAQLPHRPAVQVVVSDFERALWAAVREVLPGVVQRGCAFHFSQAIWRNIQSVGLQVSVPSVGIKQELIYLKGNLVLRLNHAVRDLVSDRERERERERERREERERTLYSPQKYEQNHIIQRQRSYE